MIANKQVPTAMNQLATTEELLEVAFSVVCAAAFAMQWRGKHISAATVQLQ
jgi:alkylhydroperoxidase/carboxymuconolactone decarboxylase family protein YurZ